METTHSSKACTESLNAVEDALYVIGGKWKLRVIIALKDNTLRFNELQRTVNGISAKVLSGELKDLELNGFVKRKVNTEGPLMVSYELAPYSETLNHVLSALTEWGKIHREKIRAEASLS